jgi:hypothetical protein
MRAVVGDSEHRKEEKMHTLFDFITHIKIVEYLVSIMFIAGFMIFWEALKPRPFRTVVNTTKDDIAYIKENGKESVYKTMGRIVSAPFIGLAYVVAVPFVFAYAIFSAVAAGLLNLVGREAAFGWRPSEAYLAGRKKKEEKKKDDKE